MSESTLTFDDIDSAQKEKKDSSHIYLKESSVVNTDRKFGESNFYVKISLTDGVGNEFESFFTIQELRKAIKRGIKHKTLHKAPKAIFTKGDIK